MKTVEADIVEGMMTVDEEAAGGKEMVMRGAVVGGMGIEANPTTVALALGHAHVHHGLVRVLLPHTTEQQEAHLLHRQQGGPMHPFPLRIQP